jgi:hypothetical protein
MNLPGRFGPIYGKNAGKGRETLAEALWVRQVARGVTAWGNPFLTLHKCCENTLFCSECGCDPIQDLFLRVLRPGSRLPVMARLIRALSMSSAERTGLEADGSDDA